MNPETVEVTRLLADWRGGDRDALDQLMPLIYTELRALARRHMGRERASHTLQTTALVNEAYLKLAGPQEGAAWQDRTHFFALAAQVMRHILVDHARARQYAKRGGGAQQITLDEALAVSAENTEDILAIHEALERLHALDPRKARIVELKYFGGLGTDEIAGALGVSEITIKREWLKAKAWLFRELSAAN
ncbi:MAG: sigma-70 family RNA polymerase sigma factor [Blastocatellia bacterium]